ncbi:MAG: UMP kinase [SAR324 cluster bacterium]|nr:UMP kinase [SAR324 cluster bacterium]
MPSDTFSNKSKLIREKNKVKYSRILIKLSGEHFRGEKDFGFSHDIFLKVAHQIKKLHFLGIELAIVIGGGNIFRGAKASDGVDRVNADNIGMLATLMNGLYLQNLLESIHTKTRLMSAVSMPTIAETYIRRRAVRHLEKGRIIILGSGTGNPFFTTDTAAVLRGREINADIVVKCTNVDGVYDKDPAKYQDAKKFDTIKFQQALSDNLKIMDSTAFSFSKTHNLNIYVLDISKEGALIDFVTGKGQGTLVKT